MEYTARLKAWSLCSLRKETVTWLPPPHRHAGLRLVCFEDEVLLDTHRFGCLICLLPQKITLAFPEIKEPEFWVWPVARRPIGHWWQDHLLWSPRAAELTVLEMGLDTHPGSVVES